MTLQMQFQPNSSKEADSHPLIPLYLGSITLSCKRQENLIAQRPKQVENVHNAIREPNSIMHGYLTLTRWTKQYMKEIHQLF